MEAATREEAERLALEELRDELAYCNVDEDEPIEVIDVRLACSQCKR